MIFAGSPDHFAVHFGCILFTCQFFAGGPPLLISVMTPSSLSRHQFVFQLTDRNGTHWLAPA